MKAVSAREPYTARTYAVEAEADRRIAPGLRAGGIAGWARQSMVETAPGGLLDRSAVTGSGRWSAFRIGPRLSLDTRNSSYYPTSGAYATATLTQCPRFAGSDFAFGQMEIDAHEPARLPGAHLRYAYGGALRIRLNDEGANLRGDLAWNREGESAQYITFMEAF